MIELYLLYFLSGLFLYSSIQKLFSYNTFLKAIFDFGIKKKIIAILASVCVLSAELIIAIALFVNYSTKIFLFLAILLMISFTVLFIRVARKGDQITCNCFGDSEKKTNVKFSIIRNVLIIVLLVLGILQHKSDYVDFNNISLLIFFLNIIIIFQVVRKIKQIKQISIGKESRS
ncbi:MauE/DoxX family redox-associated membrane protein [Paenibacillus hunanensis]|uniref:MauE/DoxX family redox-associated membrane protein n=1 Tax=Paenibacillus hunanensis TaxID=539262 RepID=UPI003D6A30CC